MAKIPGRKDEHRVKKIDAKCVNKFRWEWLESEVEVPVGKENVKMMLALSS